MAEMEDKIKELLSSPDSLNNIMSLLRGFTGSNQQAEPMQEPASSTAASAPPSSAAPVSFEPEAGSLPVSALQAGSKPLNAAPAMSALPDFSALSKIDPKYVATAMRILNEYSVDDEKILLLNALKPHLKNTRRERVDKAAQILRMTKTIRAALNGLSGGDQLV